MTPVVAASAGFLLAVLWFDLMFDVQTLAHRRTRDVLPEDVLASIAAYYRRVTTTARPMNRLVGLAMMAAIVAIGVQISRRDAPTWVGWSSLALILPAVALAATRVFGNARRLGAREDPVDVQSHLARAICRDHLMCLVCIISVLAVQLGFGR